MAGVDEVVGGSAAELVERGAHVGAHAFGSHRGVLVRGTRALGQHGVDDAHLAGLGGAHLHDGGCLGSPRAILPEDRGETLRREHRVHRVFLHGHAVGQRQRERAAAAALAQKHAHHGHAQARERQQVVGDGVALSALLRFHAAERALRVHEAHHRTAELLGLAHETQRLAVALRLRAAEVARDTFAQVGALFLGDHRHRAAADPSEAAYDGPVVAEHAVAVQLDEAVHERVDVGERRRTVHVARQLHALPRAVRRRRAGLAGGRGRVLQRHARFGIVPARAEHLLQALAHGGAASVEALGQGGDAAAQLGAAPGHVPEGQAAHREVAVRHRVVRVGAAGQVLAHGVVAHEDVAVARLVVVARRHRGGQVQRQQMRERAAQLVALHDGVDQAVLERELGGLETLGQLLLDGVLDDALPREADERARLGQDDVALHGERRGDAARRGVGEH